MIALSNKFIITHLPPVIVDIFLKLKSKQTKVMIKKWMDKQKKKLQV